MKNFFILLFLFVCAPVYASKFEGELVLEPKGCEQTGECTVKNKLRFTDEKGLVWEAAAGLKTDGASIPAFFQPFVGEPFEPLFLRAAIVHDHYCKRHVRSWRITHRVFYEGLLDQGVDKVKAKVMYYAVYLGGPKWVKLIPGENCGKNCINAITTAAGKPVINYREADYSLFDMNSELSSLAIELASDPDSMSLEDIEKRAQIRRPNDYYYRHGDTVFINNIGATE